MPEAAVLDYVYRLHYSFFKGIKQKIIAIQHANAHVI